MVQTNLEPIFVLCGPTAVGKSDLALRFAKEVGAGIISADSQLVWKGCDIGTAKPSAEARKKIPHYLIDILEPDESFDVSQYQNLVDAAIAELRRKKKPILVVGGAGLYLRILEFGLCEAPAADPQLRESLQKKSLEELYKELESVDEEAFHQIHTNDKKRMIRALEVYHQTGKTMSAFQKEHRFAKPRYSLKKIGITLPRELLYQRIERRVDAMVAAGWLEEVQQLLKKYPADGQGLKALGYREWVAHLQGTISFEETVALIKKKTRHFAKRQETWFRSDPTICWVRLEEVTSQGLAPLFQSP